MGIKVQVGRKYGRGIMFTPGFISSRFLGLLDKYSGAAAAYSVRRLQSNQTEALRVRETGGGTEADIGFDVDGNLDETALLNHVGSNDGYVVRWYDQSGNGNDATQSTASAQPKIVSAGSVIKENGKPVLDLDGSDDALFNSSLIFNGGDKASTFTVHRTVETADNKFLGIGDEDEAGDGSTFDHTTEYGLRVYGGNKLFSTSASDIQSLFVGISPGPNATDLKGFLNGSQLTVSSSTAQSLNFTGGVALGGRFSPAGNGIIDHIKVLLQEITIYPSDQSANRTGIEGNINNYFNIY